MYRAGTIKVSHHQFHSALKGAWMFLRVERYQLFGINSIKGEGDVFCFLGNKDFPLGQKRETGIKR